jgi:hypothetical protein
MKFNTRENFININATLLTIEFFFTNTHAIKMRDLALEGLAAVVNRVTCSAPVPGSTLYVHACHPRGALPAPGLAGCSVGHGE